MTYFALHKTNTGEKLPLTNKLPLLLETGAVIVNEPKINEGITQLICVIHGYSYELCVYIPNREILTYILQTEFRQKTWLLYEGARKLSGY